MEEKPKTQEELDNVAYPAKDFNKKTFTFSQQELEDLKPLQDAVKLVQTFISLGQLAQRAADAYVGNNVLTRLGVKQSKDTKANYDLEKNRIIVYEPRLWCSVCNERKAEFKYQDKIFCETCIEKVKKELAKPIEEKPVSEAVEVKEPKKTKKK